MIDNNYKEALTEVSEILKYMPQKAVKQLPKNVINFIEKNKDKEYIFFIDEKAPFEEQDIKEETGTFLAILMLKYWDKDNKDELLKTYAENEQKYQEKLHEKYSIDIFGQDREIDEEDSKQEEMSLIEYKQENIFVRFFKSIPRFIKDFFADD